MTFSMMPVVLLLPVLALSWYLGFTPPLITLLYLLFSLVTFIAYARDKSAARKGLWRIQEKTLQLLALCGGWPGALIAQQVLRHKTRKASFQRIFWSALMLNCAGLVWLHSPSGSPKFHTLIYDAEEWLLLQTEHDISVLLPLTRFHPKTPRL